MHAAERRTKAALRARLQAASAGRDDAIGTDARRWAGSGGSGSSSPAGQGLLSRGLFQPETPTLRGFPADCGGLGAAAPRLAPQGRSWKS